MNVQPLFLFDFFGVLSTPCYYPVIKNFIPTELQEKFIAKLDDLDIGLLPENELIQSISEQINKTPEQILKMADSNSELNIELIEFIEKTLFNKFNIGLLTNIPANILQRLFSDYLAMFTPKYISSELKMIKPHKDIFEYVIKSSKHNPSDIYFIDDSQKNIDMAKSLGINTIKHSDNVDTIEFIKSTINEHN